MNINPPASLRAALLAIFFPFCAGCEKTGTVGQDAHEPSVQESVDGKSSDNAAPAEAELLSTIRELTTKLAQTESDFENTRKELEASKKELLQLQTDFANYKQTQRETFARMAAGLTLGDLQVKEKTLKGVVVTSVEHDKLKVVHNSGTAELSLHELQGDARILFGLDSSIVKQQHLVARESSTAPIQSSPSASEAPPSSSGSLPTSTFKQDCVVLITTDSGMGSGFIVETKEGLFIYTNAHVLCGSPGTFSKKIVSIVTSTGKRLKPPHELELSMTYKADEKGLEDLARFKVYEQGLTAYQLSEQGEPITIGDQVVAYGNSHGGGVTTKLDGEVIGIGGDRMEISCEIVQGNSGGPVVSATTGKVVGISTYLTDGSNDKWSKETRFRSIRRFALRPEKVEKWRRMETTSLFSMLAQFDGYLIDTRTLYAACFLTPKPNRTGFVAPQRSQGDFSLYDLIVNPAGHRLTQTIVSGIARVNARFPDTKSDLAYASAARIYSGFYTTVKQASAQQTNSFEQTDYPPYLKQFVKDLVAFRKEVDAAFAKSAINMANQIK